MNRRPATILIVKIYLCVLILNSMIKSKITQKQKSYGQQAIG